MHDTPEHGSIAERLGRVGLPAPLADLAARRWDDIIVGGGHNGLTCAAYLAKAGRKVLVLERRDRLGGACTLERPFDDDRYIASPCAYVIGLLDRTVIAELELRRHGLEVFVADPQLWVPFDDGTAFTEWVDERRTDQALRDLGVKGTEVEAFHRYTAFFDEIRQRLRTRGRDLWAGEAPSDEEIADRLDGNQAMLDVVFRVSISDVLDDFFVDQRLKDALFGQGVIGTFAGPKDPGTASVKLMHYAGEIDGRGAVWGYVKGGMGAVSFAIAEAAREAGASLACEVPVAKVVPEEGVVLEDGTRLFADNVICNADPKVLTTLLGEATPDAMRDTIDRWDVRSPVVKFNAALERLPDFTAAAGSTFWASGTADVTGGLDSAQDAFESCVRGEPAVGFGEIYVQTVVDPSPAPAGRHLLSVFGQYAPYTLNAGGWDARRSEVATQFIDLIERFAPGFSDCILEHEVLGPPDIEERIGLTGGHIFQGEVRPEQMWSRRLSARTDVKGVYLCGAATHPAGSVIGLNGKNAAGVVLSSLVVA